MSLSGFVVGMISVGLMLLAAGGVSGQDYPNKPIRIVTSLPGGNSDFYARQIAQGISGFLGQPVIVENRAVTVASEIASNGRPDGYTLFVSGATLWISPLLQKVSYDVVRDFSPISLIAGSANVVAVHPSVAAKSVKELIALAKARPGELNYAATGIGGTSHLATELFKSMAGVNIVLVTYKGNGPALNGVIGGEVQLIFATVGTVGPHIKSGKLRALAVTSAEPSTLVPGVPTVAASGLPGYEAVGMTSIWAPAKTPGVIINRLNQEIVRFLHLPSVKERFSNTGEELIGSSPEQLAVTMKSDMARWGNLIKNTGIKVD